ncbi:hypothetical protein SAMN04487967_1287 [Natronorubrum sediminis]|uniref:Uncharacterized protein n=1 Tax=Natronorubrum sediminis TaxID=640943 RepID=A0A1H6FQW5_9EURY|nr:hypothetical protein [Natronorubrum sediminis]SEH13309.1 hypothetical protein SAMN04487967_1287 [Natronorubrum sediminis]
MYLSETDASRATAPTWITSSWMRESSMAVSLSASEHSEDRTVVTFMHSQREWNTMDRNQFIALGFAILMMTSMIAMGALAAI